MKKRLSIPVDPEPIYFVRSPKHLTYCAYPARLVEKFHFRVVRERFRVFRATNQVNSFGYRAELIRDISMSEDSLKELRLLYRKEMDFYDDLPF